MWFVNIAWGRAPSGGFIPSEVHATKAVRANFPGGFATQCGMRPTYAVAVATRGSATFGVLNAMSACYNPRLFQFALKLVF